MSDFFLKIKLKNYIIEYLYILIGTFFMAIATVLFLLPNQLSTGGFSGIATIIYYLLDYPVGATTIIMNIPLLLIAFLKIDKRLFFKSIIGTILLSIFMDTTEGIIQITNDRFLSCIYGGIIMGLGTGIILKAGASTGGTDLLSYVIKSYNNKYRTSKIIIIVDIIIIVLNTIFFGDIEIGLYSCIAIYIMGKIIDIVFEGIYFTKIMFIISDKYDEISKLIGSKVKRGSTGLYSKGMYSGDEKIMLFCVGSRKEIIEIKQIVKRVDKNAFIVTTDAIETLGKGFSD